jgi:hypothetical protein
MSPGFAPAYTKPRTIRAGIPQDRVMDETLAIIDRFVAKKGNARRSIGTFGEPRPGLISVWCSISAIRTNRDKDDPASGPFGLNGFEPSSPSC